MATIGFESHCGRFDIYITCRRLKSGSIRHFWMFAVMPMYGHRGYTVYSVLTRDLDDSLDREIPPRIDRGQLLDDTDLVLSKDVLLEKIHASHPFFKLIRQCHHENRSFIMNILTQLRESSNIPYKVLIKWYSDWYRQLAPPSAGPSAAGSSRARPSIANLDAAVSAAGLSRASARTAGPATADPQAAASSWGNSEGFISRRGPPSASASATKPSTTYASHNAPDEDPPLEINLSNIDVSAEVLALAGLTPADRPWLRRMRAKYATIGVTSENIWVSDSSFRLTGISHPEGATPTTKLSETDPPVSRNFRDKLSALGIPADAVSIMQSDSTPVIPLLPADTSVVGSSESFDPIFDAVRAKMSELKMPTDRFSLSEVVTTGIPRPSFFVRRSPRPMHDSASDSSSYYTASPRSSSASTESPSAAYPGSAGPSSFNPSRPSTPRRESASISFSSAAANPWLKGSQRPYSPVAAIKAAGALGKVLYVPNGQTGASVSAAYAREVLSPAADWAPQPGRGSSTGRGLKGGCKSKRGQGSKNARGFEAGPPQDSPIAALSTAAGC
ncbi:hypothetical protein EPUS_06280 [Endocarpon pusillum Z07020]|uniref:Uncharacterized protein n=1 Tax=Endocarpon pusillum (strain Z07020 / HMAS-L-300199) TaxID=1263415 RepID=U1GH97_ENDPU|nr:uncharacterized protein EPUS_06280 [Endocarpon pusillum Z07020]ERF77062.1 hypothetical protein EPUS_06280 [Endocarpon pusillum Z07020]